MQACRDVTRLVGARAKVDHLAASVLERVKDAKESLTDEMVSLSPSPLPSFTPSCISFWPPLFTAWLCYVYSTKCY